MSYNIDSFKVKEMTNLVIPIKALYPEDKKNYHPNKPEMDLDSDKITIRGYAEGFEVSGKKVGGDLHVEKINIYGEGSGTFMGEVLQPALQQSKGTLRVLIVWAGGDTVEMVKYKDGKLTEENL